MHKYLSVAALAVASATIHADTTLLSSTFENVANGAAINGKAFTGGTAGGNWLKDGTSATFTSSNTVNNGGSFSGKLTRTSTATTGTYLYGLLGGAAGITPTAGDSYVGSADFYVTSTTAATFGLQFYSADLTELGGVSFYGGDTSIFDTPPTNGHVILGDHNEDQNSYFALDTQGNYLTYNLNSWNNLKIRLDYTSATSVTASYFLNGSQLYTSFDGTVLSALTTTTTTADGDISLSDLDVYTSAFAAANGATAYVDNYSVTKITPVPEPSAFAALGLGAVAVLRRRNKKA